MSFLLCIRRPLLRAAGGPWIAQAAATGRRQASVKAQGAYKKKNKRCAPKKLGAKKTGDQYVIPGNILWKQRGTIWWPGENCYMGRDHTIHAGEAGYVKFYRDPERHPRRKFIGVVFKREDKLPYPRNAERKRRLGMKEVPRRTKPLPKEEFHPSGIPFEILRKPFNEPEKLLRLRSDYSYREDNWRIGRLVTTTGIRPARFRTRKQSYRFRRWQRERSKTGLRKAGVKRKVQTGPVTTKTVSVKGAKRAAKQSKLLSKVQAAKNERRVKVLERRAMKK
ncbi:50S ribosomal protein L27 [Ophiocordyceps camponoti-floridani]|uniref:Large ribosomal subunit protein bL27m n=1 Tax=Ophiocordyceps camponoti-floridani TaxID=2030778 RepID=A0A8H4Q8C2_9HYPO|nr:50S ribosomal protein L27 [Ophiocordyceps camponoti-floridani]